MDMWSTLAVLSEAHTGCWNGWSKEVQDDMEKIDRVTTIIGSFRLSTPKKGTPGDQVRDLLCVQLVSNM